MVKETSPEDAFIREVDEEYRRDQIASFWTRYGRWILVVVGLVLIALAAFLWWHQQQGERRGRSSEEFAEAMQGLDLGDDKAKAALQRFAAGDYGGYSLLARFKTADLAEKNGDNAAALKTYAGIAADSGAPQPLRQLAALKSVRLGFDEAKPDAIIEKLKPLAQPGDPWFGVAGEMLAITYMRVGKDELAGPIFSAIAADASQPPPLRQRAQQMAGSLGANGIPQTAVPPTMPPAAPPAPAPQESH